MQSTQIFPVQTGHANHLRLSGSLSIWKPERYIHNAFTSDLLCNFHLPVAAVKDVATFGLDAKWYVLPISSFPVQKA